MDKFLEQMNTLKKMSLTKEYEYEYYKKTSNGMAYDTDVNAYFGKSREGFEKFKNENNDSYVDIPSTYIRAVHDSETNNVNGFVLETQIHPNPNIEKAKQLYNIAYEYLCEKLAVTDRDALNVYIDINSNCEYTTIDSYKHRMEFLYDILVDYKSDDEFRLLIDKIIS
jgi:hypothetical protein